MDAFLIAHFKIQIYEANNFTFIRLYVGVHLKKGML